MATVNLGNIKLNWKGAYNSSTAYIVDDVVSYNGSSYVCILASTGNLPTVTTYWNQMSAKGTDGTDISTTLTTQGDILYRDGSGLQRLAAGTANQVLQTGGAGANPSWGTVSSDWVKLVETTAGGSEGSISVDGYFSSTYKIYKAFISNVCFNADPQGYFNFRVNVGGSAHNANYYCSEDGVYATSGANTAWAGRRWNAGEYQMGGWNAPTVNATGTNSGTHYDVTFFDPQSSFYKNIQIVFGGWERGQTYTYTGDLAGVIHQTSALTGFTIKNNAGGTFRAGTKISLYGLK